MHLSRFTYVVMVWLGVCVVTTIRLIIPASKVADVNERKRMQLMALMINWICVAVMVAWYFLVK